MTQSEAILEYIDGTLDHDAEQALFDSMARHPELRSTLRQFISIGSAVHADREAYAPPAHVEQALLAGLGLVPSSTGAVAASSATGSLLGWFGGKKAFTVTMTLGWGYLAGTALFLGLLVLLVAAQILAKRFNVFLYWATIVASCSW